MDETEKIKAELFDWEIIPVSGPDSPEDSTDWALIGKIYDHPDYEDSTRVTTGVLRKMCNCKEVDVFIVETDDVRYRIEKPSNRYAQFVAARGRTLGQEVRGATMGKMQ